MNAKKACGLLLVAAMLTSGAAMAAEKRNQETAPQVTAGITIAKNEPGAGASGGPIQSPSAAPEADDELEANNGGEEASIADPIEPFNRAMFTFNDKLYFWALKPVARGYSYVVPEPARVAMRNVYSNVKTPVRFVNTLLQGKFTGAGTEFARLVINSTIGIGGLFDVAKSHFDLEMYDEDFGQTLGFYGMGGVMYIVWPFFGPSTIRDSLGMAADSALNPTSYIEPFGAALGVSIFEKLNKTSLSLGTYEDIIASSVEPYTGVRDGFIQLRNKQIKK